MCDTLKRFGVSMEPSLLAQLDHFVIKKGFQNRSHAIRSIVRETLLRNLTDKNVIYASISLSKNALETRFGQIIQRCEQWGNIKAFTTVFIDIQTVSIQFTLEITTEHIVGLQQDPLLQPVTIYLKRSETNEIND